ncbi:hypothetical protein LR013_03160 [candidate division NPL-UPA2 bacterium]|nr:hypothetical protein [candidate division NPL-UPA2 bacterium]
MGTYKENHGHFISSIASLITFSFAPFRNLRKFIGFLVEHLTTPLRSRIVPLIDVKKTFFSVRDIDNFIVRL